VYHALELPEYDTYMIQNMEYYNTDKNNPYKTLGPCFRPGESGMLINHTTMPDVYNNCITKEHADQIMVVLEKLANFQFEEVNDNYYIEMIKECQVRLLSMPFLYEKFNSSGGPEELNVYDYIKFILRNVFLKYGVLDSPIALKIDVEKIFLNYYTAVFFGLIVNELVTNSLRHAYPEWQEGNVYIGFKKHEEDNKHTLIINDDGVGIPRDMDFLAEDAAGLKIVRFIVRIMNGKIEVNRKSPTEFRITF
jgi:two-component sensor histidine kinase